MNCFLLQLEPMMMKPSLEPRHSSLTEDHWSHLSKLPVSSEFFCERHPEWELVANNLTTASSSSQDITEHLICYSLIHESINTLRVPWISTKRLSRTTAAWWARLGGCGAFFLPAAFSTATLDNTAHVMGGHGRSLRLSPMLTSTNSIFHPFNHSVTTVIWIVGFVSDYLYS